MTVLIRAAGAGGAGGPNTPCLPAAAPAGSAVARPAAGDPQLGRIGSSAGGDGLPE
jgi:hypothetical protein